jgi:acetyltransferase
MATSVLESAFCPRSIAVIGASNNPDKLGYKIVQAVGEGGFKGRLHPVNVGGGNIFGMKMYRNVSEIPGQIDLALIAIPANLVPEAVKECGKKKVRSALVFSAGFGEIQGGAGLEQELTDTAKKYNVRIIGPNTNGIMNLNDNLNATFTPGLNYRTGNVAFVCQSGGYSSLLLRYGSGEGVGFSKIINLGNSCDIGFADSLEFLMKDDCTQAIILYMEGFKHENEGRRFLETAKEVTKTKPIVVVKVGRTEAGRRAAYSHTGSLAGSDELYNAAFRQAGLIRASDGVEMIDIAKTLSLEHRLPRGNRTAIITNLGGPAVVAADFCESRHIKIGELSEETKERLRKMLSFTASYANPVDLAADWPKLHLYADVLNAVLKDKQVDIALVIVYIPPQSKHQTLIEDIVAASKKNEKPIVVCCLSTDSAVVADCIGRLDDYSIASFRMPENAAKAIAALIMSSRYMKKVRTSQPSIRRKMIN